MRAGTPPTARASFRLLSVPALLRHVNTYRRRKLLANAEVHEEFSGFAHVGEPRGIAVGRYVIMPDHIHLFVRGHIDFVLTQWVRLLKRRLSNAIAVTPPHWQAGFFDHLIRNSESYAAKWEYVRENPTRAGLVATYESWPYQGELVQLEAL